MHAHRTSRLGDAIHACAVANAATKRGATRAFSVYQAHAEIFRPTKLTLILNPHGTSWPIANGRTFDGPIHGEHVRVTMARAAGIDVTRSDLILSLDFQRQVTHQPYVILCPDAAVTYKEWADAQWSSLAEHIIAMGFEVIVCRAPGRPSMPLPEGGRAFDASLIELAHLIANASFLVGVDSGHIHLADAIGTPVIGLYAATSTITYGPFRDAQFCIDRHTHAAPNSSTYNSSTHFRQDVMKHISIDDVTAMTHRVAHLLP